MPKVKYTAEKGLFQESGAGSENLFHIIQPGGVATTTATGATAIPLTHAVVTHTAGGSVAITLADGTPGQVLQIIAADANTATLTPDTSTGWATCVFDDAGDRATFYYVNDTVGWIILGTSGVSAPPVTTV